ncbi:uncharacterized protein LOC131147864 [Malania oleifera]|uniref:uncharacterized protein LOC131147864 n=1 Tax=Malania oleifera TaxID=397392 RepID=UPI0025AE743E|nr:uncharacterized protein LOC131147864 [Malania oleifera]
MKGLGLFGVLVFLVLLLCGHSLGKECTNTPTQLSSHTYRYALLTSNNQTWKDEMFSFYHLIPTDDSAWSNMLPRKVLREEDEFKWTMMYRTMKNAHKSSDSPGGNFLKEVSLHNVRLDPDSLQGRAQQTNLEYLLLLNVDSLVWSFRKTAGLPTIGTPYGGWEAPTGELRGHFVGHYLSASALMWASTHNDSLKEKMSAVVFALSACQDEMGTGYLSAFPSELFDRFEAIKPVWAPYYTIHKILAGLLDQYSFAGNTLALKMTTRMVEYFCNRVQNVISKYSIERHWMSLNEETGGMNDVLYRLYSITGDQKHIWLAHLFDKPCFLGLLAVKADDLSGFHANTHIPVVIGSQMRYELTGDPLYKEISTYFMDVVNSSHSFATGGTSFHEFWTDPKRLANTLDTENEESCTTYNMLKVSRHLFRWTKEIAYADYYERAVTNGVLSIQRGREPGIMIYMLPLGPGNSKARSYHGWGTQFNSFWCCYGTAIESFSKLGDSIYFEEEGKQPALYITQYISSSLDWESGKIVLNQQVDPVVSWEPFLRVNFTISSKEGAGQSSALQLRVPTWSSSNGAKAVLNGQNLQLPPPGNFHSVSVSPGSKLNLELPMSLRTEPIKDDRPDHASLQAILYGPYLLVGLSSGDLDIKTESAAISQWTVSVPYSQNSQLVSLSQKVGSTSFSFTNSNQSITMENFPAAGTDAAVHATFRLIVLDRKYKRYSNPKDAIGKSVMLEPFNFPGMVVVEQGENGDVTVANFDSSKNNSAFRLVAGLDGKNETVSLESERQNGCFVYSGIDYKSGLNLKLSCNSESTDDGFKEATSFVLNGGISQYHPISFVANGGKRNFLLQPLFSLRDESYVVYFNIQP